MRAWIDVKDRAEAAAIRAGLAHPETRATVVVSGLLLQLPSQRSRSRVVNYIIDKIDEEVPADDRP